jgi:high-affinity nickel-transport protein
MVAPAQHCRQCVAPCATGDGAIEVNLEMSGASLVSSLALIGLMGFRHGFDADHIAVVDGMTRARQLHRSYWSARRVGLEFAAGHSATILVASLLFFGQSAALPRWLDGLGMVISTLFLLFIAVTNFGHALRAADQAAPPLGLLSSALMRASGGHVHPALVGMAFAVSFDSMAQAAFFAARGSEFSGMAAVTLMAVVFGLGMTIADAANGALLAWFAGQSDRLARRASRFSSAFIALVALSTAAAGLLRQQAEGFARAWEASGLWVGVGLLALTSAVYLVRIELQRRRIASPG